MNQVKQNQNPQGKLHEPPNPARVEVAALVQAARQREGLPPDERLAWSPPTPLDELRRKMELRADPEVQARIQELIQQGHDQREARAIAIGEVLQADRCPPGTEEFAAQYLNEEAAPRQRLEYRFAMPAQDRRRTR